MDFKTTPRKDAEKLGYASINGEGYRKSEHHMLRRAIEGLNGKPFLLVEHTDGIHIYRDRKQLFLAGEGRRRVR